MKNIHVLPTDKPSRVAYNFSKLILNSKLLSPVLYKTQHIYITSNDRPKRYDYFLNGKGKIIKSSSDHSICDHKKIILTTDQDLINDGVQSIDDEFLEWFIKNPSCEEVEVIYEPKNFFDVKKGWEYKIIIPKEEPKQETLEEAAERIYPKNIVSDGYDTNFLGRVGLYLGAKWQQERSYSEEEVLKMLFDYQQSYSYASNEIGLKKWFEQFKKK
jgi:hypothetical protein